MKVNHPDFKTKKQFKNKKRIIFMKKVTNMITQHMTIEAARDYLKFVCQKDDGGNLFLSLNYNVTILRECKKVPDQFSSHLTHFVSGLVSEYDSFFQMLAWTIKYYNQNGKVQPGTCWMNLLGLEINTEEGETLPFPTIGLLREIGLAGRAWSKVPQKGRITPNEFYLEGAHLPITAFCQRELASIHISCLEVQPENADVEVWLHSSLTVGRSSTAYVCPQAILNGDYDEFSRI